MSGKKSIEIAVFDFNTMTHVGDYPSISKVNTDLLKDVPGGSRVKNYLKGKTSKIGSWVMVVKEKSFADTLQKALVRKHRAILAGITAKKVINLTDDEVQKVYHMIGPKLVWNG